MTEIMETAAGENETLETEQADGARRPGACRSRASTPIWRAGASTRSCRSRPPSRCRRRPRCSPPYPSISVKPNVPLGTAFVRAACAQLVVQGQRARCRRVRRRALGRLDAGSRAVPQGRRRARHDDRCDLGGAARQSEHRRTTSSSCCGRRRSSARSPACATCRSTAKSRAQTAGGTYGWVGEAKPKPVTKLAFASTSLGITKVAGIIVLTEELVLLVEPERRGAGPRRHDRGDCAVPRCAVHRSGRGRRRRRQSRRRSRTARRPPRRRPTRSPTSWG